MVLTRGQMKEIPLPPSAGWRVGSEAADDGSEYDQNEQLHQEDDSEEEQDVDMADDESLVDESLVDESLVGEEEGDVDRGYAMAEPESRCARGRREEPDEADSVPRSTRSWSVVLLILVLLLGSGCGMYLYPKEIRLLYLDIEDSGFDPVASVASLFSSGGSSSPSNPPSTWDRFKEKFKNEFTPKYLNAVPKSSIKVIRAAVEDVMRAHAQETLRESLSPSVILILGKEGNKNVTCFTRDLEGVIASSYNEDTPLRIQGESVDAGGIDAAFREVFQVKKHHLIVIDGLNKLDAQSAAHLHRFTDHG